MSDPMMIELKNRSGLILLLLLSVLIAGCATTAPSGGSLAPTATPSVVLAPTPTPLVVPTGVADEEAVLVNLYARANPSVVNVTIFGRQGGQVAPLGQGSGFVYDDTGHIVTNAHVVADADRVEVTFADGTILPAGIVGQDPNSDLAVVKVDHLPTDAGPLPLGDLSELAVGQTVVAIGNPFGLEGTLTRGIVSALGRTIPALTPFSIPQAIQTDAAINPGNSGGPLLDLHGHVVGVNAQIETDGTSRSNSGVGFAIPVSVVSRVVPALIENGKYEWAWLGVRGGSLTPTLIEALKLPADQRGAYIAEVTPNGPAQRAGLRGATDTVSVSNRAVDVGGDVVTAIDSRPVRSFDDLLLYVALEARPDQEVTLTVIRDGRLQEVRARLDTRPAAQDISPIP